MSSGSLLDVLLPSLSSETELLLFFLLVQALGKGSFGKVIRATWKAAPPPGMQQREVALKIINKREVKGVKGQDIMGEMEVLTGLDHPNIVSRTLSSHRMKILKEGLKNEKKEGLRGAGKGIKRTPSSNPALLLVMKMKSDALQGAILTSSSLLMQVKLWEWFECQFFAAFFLDSLGSRPARARR